MPYPARVDVERFRLTFMHFMSAREDSNFQEIYGQDPGEHKKNKNDEKKYNDTDDCGNRIFCSGQSSTDSVYVGPVDSVKGLDVVPRETNGLTKAGLARAIGTGTIYNSTSPYHNVSHDFTYLVAMRDYCNKTLLQMRDNGESDGYRMNKKLSKKLKKELSKAKAELASAKFNGLKTERGMYEDFLKQINDRFKH